MANINAITSNEDSGYHDKVHCDLSDITVSRRWNQDQISVFMSLPSTHYGRHVKLINTHCSRSDFLQVFTNLCDGLFGLLNILASFYLYDLHYLRIFLVGDCAYKMEREIQYDIMLYLHAFNVCHAYMFRT